MALGSNLGDRRHYLEQAILEIGRCPGVQFLERSPVLETEPLVVVDQPKFLNIVILIRCDHSPVDLLAFTQNVERKLGRVKTANKGPRIIDVDILSFSTQTIATDELVIPHQSVGERKYIQELFESMGHQKEFQAILELKTLNKDAPA